MVFNQGSLVIGGSFIAALILTILPLPQWAIPFRPEWVLLTLFYWGIALPQRVGIFSGWLSGLLVDVAQGMILGQNALLFTLFAYITSRLSLRLRIYHPWRQAILLFLMALTLQLESLIIHGIIDTPERVDFTLWLPPITTMLLWPSVLLLLRNLRQGLGVE
ncbi:MAG: rod shape-determining protein MreD [Gammaproteobacteria bacterium]|nr:rod shape-determining protein MreD [Gammaproteobacteria bacterium]